MKIALGADHAGYALKRILKDHLISRGHAVLDLGTHSEKPVDYPDYAHKIAKAVAQGRAERGLMVCGSGVGACVAANKVPGIRAGTCHDTFSAHQGVEDDDANVLCLGSRVIGERLAMEIVDVWTQARFSKAKRHVRRLKKVLALENTYARR